MPEPDMPIKQEQPEEEPKIKVSDWVKKFSQSEKRMKSEFRPKYNLAKRRLRSEYSILNRNSDKLTHEQVNLVHSIGESFVDSVYFKAPECNLTAREEVDHNLIENTEVVVNDWLKDKQCKKTIKRCIWDGYLGGMGWRFIDYEYDDIENPNQIVSPAVNDPVTGQEIQPAKLGRIVLKNDIKIQRIRPDMVRFPAGFDLDEYNDSPWLGFESIMTLDEVKNNEKWDKDIRDGIEGERYEMLSSDDRKGKNEKGTDSDDLYVKISFSFIKPETPLDKMKLLIFHSKSADKPLSFEEFDKGHVGYPLKPIYFNPLDDDCSYPNGDPWIWEAQLNAIDKWWKTFSRHVEKAAPRIFYDANRVDPNEIQKAKSSSDLEYIGLKNKEKGDIRQYFFDSNKPQVHPDVTQFYEVAKQLINEMAPKKGLSRGDSQNGPGTATEAKIMASGEMIDVEARIDTVKDFIVDIVLDVAGILEKSLAFTMPVKRTEMQPGPNGPQPMDVIKQIGKEGFTSKINADVDVESMQAQNKDVIRRQLIDALGLFVKLQPQMMQGGIGDDGAPVPPKTINFPFWIEKLMDTMHIRNIDKGFITLPPMPAIPPGMPGKRPAGPAPEQSQTIGGDMPPEAIEAGMAQRT